MLFKMSRQMWAPLCSKFLKLVIQKTNIIAKAKIPEVTRPHQLRITARQILQRQANSFGALRSSRNRGYTTNASNSILCRLASSDERYFDRLYKREEQISVTAALASKFKSSAPFAWALRPDLTGGAFPRTSGGYSIGGGQVGGVRYFSHTTVAPAQVFHKVCTAISAHAISGSRVKPNLSAINEEKQKYQCFRDNDEGSIFETQSAVNFTIGSHIDFKINPMITALPPFSRGTSFRNSPITHTLHLNTLGFLETLQNDFNQVSKDLSIILSDLRRLSLLGDLLITLEGISTLRVHFPGCEREYLERLCDDFGIQRGIIHSKNESEQYVGSDTALRFPYAPTEKSRSSQQNTHDSGDFGDESKEISWFEDYTTLSCLSDVETRPCRRLKQRQDSSDYDGIEGIYNFLQQTSALNSP